ncbi:hypothetical protein EDC01DRAFT_783887 [Geopyxis carbonaria]|nr:hypothetical protein EDC01DRAFT_783887 [Geopyxis carbonaria]
MERGIVGRAGLVWTWWSGAGCGECVGTRLASQLPSFRRRRAKDDRDSDRRGSEQGTPALLHGGTSQQR